MSNFLGKLYRFLQNRIFVNETILLFQHNRFIKNSSQAQIIYATHENISDVLNFNKPHYIPVFHKFLKIGDKGYFAYLKDKCVHRTWVKLGPQTVYPHWAIPMRLNGNEVFIHYCETAHEARGKKIYPTVLSKISQDFKDKTILISVNIKNKASIRGIEKAGFLERKKERKKENNHNSRSENNQALNIILITQGVSPIIAPIVESNHNVIGIIESAPRVEPKPFKKWLFKKLRAAYSFVTKSPTAGILSKYANQLAIPYFYRTKHNNVALEKWVKELEPDLMVVYSMSQLLKENIFSIPKYGTINLHPSYLPKYRGPNPWFWTYYYQEKQGGVTIHYIDKGEDTGDIISQESYDIPLGAKLRQLQELAINKIGIKLLLKAIDAIATGTAPRHKQPKQSPTSKGRNISNNEHEQLIDWENWAIERIWHLMRGTELWLNCIKQPKGLYKGQRWLVGEFEKCNMQNTYQVGNIYKEQSQYFVACRDGKILLTLEFSVKNFLLNFFR